LSHEADTAMIVCNICSATLGSALRRSAGPSVSWFPTACTREPCQDLSSAGTCLRPCPLRPNPFRRQFLQQMSLRGAMGKYLCRGCRGHRMSVMCFRSASGVVELAPWLASGSNRIGIMHLSTGCKPSIVRCAARLTAVLHLAEQAGCIGIQSIRLSRCFVVTVRVYAFHCVLGIAAHHLSSRCR
jgi:hypothetical protein